MQGLLLSNSTRVPIGSVLSFPSASAVSTYFGSSAAESNAASLYFNGFLNSNIKPGSILFAQYPTAAVSAYLRGGSLGSMTLAQLQALSGVLTLTVNGTVKTSSTISLSAATGFSNAATIIQAGFTSPPFSVSYDSIANAFVFTTTLTGATATITEATGTLSASLYLTVATGAVLSQGAAIATPTAFMNSLILTTTNWATFMTVFDPDFGAGNTQKQVFQAWNVLQNNRYAYIAWDTDVTPLSSNAATTSLGYILQAAASSGCVPIYGTTYEKAAFLCGAIASIDFTQHNGRSTLAFKSQSGLIIDVQNQTQLSNLIANGYNGYGSYATANQNFNFYYPGSVTGQYKWLDSFINQIWMNNSFQLNLMLLLTSVKSVPYNVQGYTLIEAACMDTITAALNFGAIGAGVPLSSLQAAEVNNAAGLAIDGILATRGWYLQILPASAQSRANRTTPPMTFWYMDAGSVQQINLGSVEVQ
jgi:hypothetical protein